MISIRDAIDEILTDENAQMAAQMSVTDLLDIIKGSVDASVRKGIPEDDLRYMRMSSELVRSKYMAAQNVLHVLNSIMDEIFALADEGKDDSKEMGDLAQVHLIILRGVDLMRVIMSQGPAAMVERQDRWNREAAADISALEF